MGKSVSVWFSEEERVKVEQAAAIAGYKHLSRYIKDKSLERVSSRESMEAWAERQEVSGRLADLEGMQGVNRLLLEMVIFMLRKKSTAGEINELILACEKKGSLLERALPEVAEFVRGLEE